MARLKLSVSGARGIVGDSLTPEVILQLGAAFASLRPGKPILVGGDTRISGPTVRHALIAGLTGAGSPVLDCGICPTPSLVLASSELDVGGGVLVTASHNPIEWNALKFIGPDGFFLSPEEGALLRRRFESADYTWSRYDRLGSIDRGPDVVTRHLERVINAPLIDEAAIRIARFRVAVDGTGGAGAAPALELLKQFGCEVKALHCEVDGYFPRAPEPKPENLGELARMVKDENCDIGFALDPDGDRLSLVSESGRPLVEEATVALATDYVLGKRKGPVVVNLSTSRAVEDIAAREGVPFYRTPVGEAHVAAKMVRTKAAIGGEGNGGVMFPDVHPMRDASTGMALILMAMTEERSLEKLVARIPQYVILKSVVKADTFDEGRLEASLIERFGKCDKDSTDGIRLSWKDRWVHVRPSNTEPVVRILTEAPDRKVAEGLQRAASEAIGA